MNITNKRTKRSRYRGTHTHGRGMKKKARGSGHRGGFGMAGTGKRADHKKSLILTFKDKYFGKKGLNKKPVRYDVINVEDLERLVKGKKELELKRTKILGRGEIKQAVNVKVDFASKTAIEKIEKAGGKVIFPEVPSSKDTQKGHKNTPRAQDLQAGDFAEPSAEGKKKAAPKGVPSAEGKKVAEE